MSVRLQSSGNKKIRVLRIINRFNIGGPTYNAVFLTRFLSDEYETLLVGGMPEDGESDSLHILEEYGIEPLLIKEMKREPRISHDRAAYLRLKTIIKEFDPDIVHTHASKAGALGRRAAIKMNVPVIVHTFHGHVFHSYFGKLKTFIFKSIERRLAKRSSGIVAISELQKKELSEEHAICKADKIHVVPLGFDLLRFKDSKQVHRDSTRARFDIADEEVAIAIIGRLVPVKNHKLFLDVIRLLSKQSAVPMKFFIVGDGPERAFIEAEIQLMQLPRNVKIVMTSWIKDIAAFNAGMDVICLTSHNEGTPVSLIEAQAAGIPVISTDVGGVRDIVQNGETGFVVPKNDPILFAEKLRSLTEDKNKREIMSQKGWSFVEDKFHYTRLVRNMEEYYSQLLSEKKC
jgi:glycosyltransferase involved in cell wall biosynthesis